MTSLHVFYNDELTMSRRRMTDYVLVVEAILELILVQDLQNKGIMMDFEA